MGLARDWIREQSLGLMVGSVTPVLGPPIPIAQSRPRTSQEFTTSCNTFVTFLTEIASARQTTDRDVFRKQRFAIRNRMLSVPYIIGTVCYRNRMASRPQPDPAWFTGIRGLLHRWGRSYPDQFTLYTDEYMRVRIPRTQELSISILLFCLDDY